MQKLGQHFLKNPAAIKKIIAAADIKKGDVILEIGPGHGELTIPLAETCQKIGAKIIAIEKDEKLLMELGNLGIKELRIMHGDALKILPELIPEFRNSEIPKFKILGNIPYYITGHLLRTIGELETKPELCIFMIQKEVAERICARPPKMNRLAASVQFWAEPKIIANISKLDFSPPPKVDSAVIRLEVRGLRFEGAEQYYSAVRMLFSQPRKTILNNIAARYKLGDRRYEADKEKIIEKLAKLGIDQGLRPQNLTIENIRAIAEAF